MSEKILVKDLVARNYRAADVFSKYGVDFCCGGGISLDEAAEKAGISVSALQEELDRAMETPDRESDLLRRLPLNELCDYILETHHTYVRENLPLVADYLARIVMAHGDRHPELEKVQRAFQESAIALTQHMQKEEIMLFPYISSLVKAYHKGAVPPVPTFVSAKAPVEVMMAEHSAEGDRFEEISRLTNQYALPEDACNTYKVALEKLKAFESDLHRHIHLENNILFPKALQLEAEIRA
jgi:regulator of cell morphogenesis and NO signaling